MSTTVATAARPAPVTNFSRQVEVVVGGRLRETTAGQGEVMISLWNKTNAPVVGPVFVVVDETGLEQVKVGSHSEETADGKAVFEVVPAGKALAPEGMTKAFPVAFSIPKGMSRDEANRFHLSTRVFGRQAPPDEAQMARLREEREDADSATQGKSYNAADLAAAHEAQRAVTPEFMKKPDVLATAVTEDAKGNLAIRVYTETRAAAKNLPGSVGKYAVQIKPLPGGFKAGPARSTVTTRNGVSASQKTRAAAAKAAQGSKKSPSLVVPVNPTLRFDRPVPIGVSSFNADTNICASGTLGFRVKDASGKLFAISNSHVWGDQGAATVGQLIIQPSQGDNQCVTDTATNTIGTLVDFTPYVNGVVASTFFRPNPLPLNFIDAALIQVTDGTDASGATVPSVGFATPSDGYGAPSSKVLNTLRIGLPVQKYGRTTGYTRGVTVAVGVMSTIGGNTPIDNTDFFRLDEFAGIGEDSNAFSLVNAFSQGGDSGSLIVTMDRRPVSHLFAGGPNLIGVDVTLGNRIGAVLDHFNVKIDDGTDPNVHTGGIGATGLGGRMGLAMGNLSRKDLIDFLGVGTTGNFIGLLPPELQDRVKPNRRPLVPINNGYF